MKMFVLILSQILTFNILTAQISNPVNVTIELSGAGQTISVNNSTVDLVFNAATDYTDGVHSGDATKDHITIGSTSGFQVVVKGAGDLSSGSNTLPLSSIVITPSNGSVVSGIAPVYTATAEGLTTADQTIITSTDGTAAAKFNVDYFAKDNEAYMSAVASHGTATYSTTITYAIMAY